MGPDRSSPSRRLVAVLAAAGTVVAVVIAVIVIVLVHGSGSGTPARDVPGGGSTSANFSTSPTLSTPAPTTPVSTCPARPADAMFTIMCPQSGGGS